MLEVSAIAAYKDNYIWLLQRIGAELAVVVDPGDATPVIKKLDSVGLALGGILVTHHHWDHTNGIARLVERWPVPVFGPAFESQPIAGLTHALKDGDRFRVDCLDSEFDVFAIPGHTLGHIALHGEGLLFCGDTLFSAGCGRLFEGTAEQMYRSLNRLASLPGSTKIYCGHEYTEANLAFALSVEPDNQQARDCLASTREQRRQGLPSLPSTLEREHAINPFLRCTVGAVSSSAERHAGKALAQPVEVFAALRSWKDSFVAPALVH